MAEGMVYVKDFLSKQEGDLLMEQLINTIEWEQREIVIFGKPVMQPRLVAWYGDTGISYGYSGIKLEAREWTKELYEVKSKIYEEYVINFNSVLLNYYRNGNDSMGWHSDDEKELGQRPIIASLSLGETRKFSIRKRNHYKEQEHLMLEHGSLLLMRDNFQHEWQHALPKSKKIQGPRINLTFRKIVKI